MHFCTCGEPATGQCVVGKEYVCARERMRYSSTIGQLLLDAGKQPPSYAAGVLCPTCYQRSIDEALPVITRYLQAQHGSPDLIAVWLADAYGRWRGSTDSPKSVAVDIITAAAGARPPWLFHNGPLSMAALFAHLARARGITPPRITVIHEENRATPTLFNRRKTQRFSTPVATFDAWHFTYRDTDRGFPKLILVNALGRAFEPGNTWSVNENQQITYFGPLDVLNNYIASTRSKLAEPPSEGYLDIDATPVLLGAVKRIL